MWFTSLQPILKEHREYGTTIDKLNELGNAYDALLRGERPESPSRRPSSVTPVKRPSITSPRKSSGIVLISFLFYCARVCVCSCYESYGLLKFSNDLSVFSQIWCICFFFTVAFAILHKIRRFKSLS